MPSHRYQPVPVEQRFWTKVERRGPDDCWQWTASVNEWGYGLVRHGRRMHGAHRIAWVLTNGPIPDGLSVLHRCDNPPCVNPSHLFVGTADDNVRDRDAKRRTARGESVSIKGERHPSHRLTADDVRTIRRRRTAGERGVDLANEYRVTKATITDIWRRRTWRHIE